jgi:hypothetical protein
MKKLCLFVLIALLSLASIGCYENPKQENKEAVSGTTSADSFKDENGKYASKLPYKIWKTESLKYS